MHFVLSWDISATGEQRTKIEEALKSCIKPYSWVRPLTTFYIIKISTQQEWDQILAALTNVASADTAKTNFIMSPPMQGGRYNGFIPKNLWDAINERTT